MKFQTILILFLLTLGQNVLAQDLPKKVKYKRIVFSGDSSFAAIYKEKKAGIYNLRENRFDLKMAKQEIVHSPYFDIFTVFTKDGYRSFSAANTEILMPLEDLNTINVSASNYAVKQIDNKVLLTDVEFEFTGTEQKESFRFDFDHPFAGSGVYNLKSRKWEVPRKYLGVQIVGEALFALNYVGTSYPYGRYSKYGRDLCGKPTFECSYDIYTKDKLGSWTLTTQNATNVGQIPLKEVFGYNRITSEQSELHHYIVSRSASDDLKDYIILKLFDTEDTWWLPEVYFELVEENIDYGVTDSLNNLILTYTASESLPIKLFEFSPQRDNKSDWKLSDSTYTQFIWAAKDELAFEGANSGYIIYDGQEKEYGLLGLFGEFSFGLVRINDDLIKCVDRGIRYVKNDKVPYSRSGIYNIKTDEWEIEPLQFDCMIGRKYNAISIMVEEDDRKGRFSESFSIQDKSKNNVLDNLDRDTLQKIPWLVKDLFWEIEMDTIYPCRNPNKLSHFENYYYHSKDRMGVVRVTDYYDNFKIDKINEGEFAYINSIAGFKVALDDANFYFSDFENKYKISLNAENSKMKVHCNVDSITYFDDYDYGVNYLVVSSIIGGKESELIRVPANEGGYSPTLATTLYIDHNNRVVLNEEIADKYSTNPKNRKDTKDIYKSELEGSAVWELKGAVWTKSTPYYASISTFKGGYICKTRSTTYIEIEGNDSTNINQVNPRYIILDNDLQPVSFIDFYDFPLIDDLGFGLKIRTDQGCMFVTYDLVAITDDVWDEFQLTNGKLMAIKNPIIEYDEFGNELPTSDGRTRTIDFPKK